MRKTASSFIVSLLFLSLFTFTFSNQPAKAEPGTIYINPDGSINSPVPANITSDKVTYNFTGDNYLPIIVNRSNIIINGKGRILQASGGNGFSLTGMANVTIKNTIITNCAYGIRLSSSSGNVLSGNNVTANSLGIRLESSSGNVLSGNNITSNISGIWLYSSSENRIYHNDFANNTQQAQVFDSTHNMWDDSYPSGGNYWSDYHGLDLLSGPGQNLTGSDGIGDTPYIIDAKNSDHYPLMAPFKTFDAGAWNDTSYYVDVISNSTLSDSKFNATAKTLRFNVTGLDGTEGFSRVAIPKGLMWSGSDAEWSVTVNGELIGDRFITNDTGYTYIYFTYHHSTQPIQIQSTSAVPEFQPFMLAPLFIGIMLLGTIIIKKKRNLEK